MAIATTEQFWNHRLNGENPTSPTGENNNAWTATGSGASEVDKFWVVSDARYNVSPTTDAYTLFTVLQYTSTPSNDEILMSLDNGTKKVEVKAFGTKVKTTMHKRSIYRLLAQAAHPEILLGETTVEPSSGLRYMQQTWVLFPRLS